MREAAVVRRSWVEHIMGMPVSIHLRGVAGQSRWRSTVEAVFAELCEVDQIFSIYNADSDVSRLRREEVTTAQCHQLVGEVLDLCEQARLVTGGYFDAWQQGPDGVIRLDPSGLVKGWAVQRSALRLAELGDDYYLNAGGDIAVSCAEPESPSWRIGIEDADQPGSLFGVLEVRGGGVATSGTGHRGGHVIDPTTGSAATALRSVTVVGPSLMWADVYATAALARGRDAISWIRWPSGYEALAVSPGGDRSLTAGMRTLLESSRRTGSARS
jgi:thiamine biosynthesis lipoprotein